MAGWGTDWQDRLQNLADELEDDGDRDALLKLGCDVLHRQLRRDTLRAYETTRVVVLTGAGLSFNWDAVLDAYQPDPIGEPFN